MLKKTITFKDLDDNDVTQDFYFNLSKVELTEIEHSMIGGISGHWTRIIDDRNTGAILAAYKQIVGTAVGKRSDDGIAFLKSKEITDHFIHSNAYEVLFTEHMGQDSDDNSFFEFLKGIVPADALKNMPQTIFLPGTDGEKGERTNERTIEQYSRDELLEMPKEEFDKLAGTNPKNWSKDVLEVAFQRRGQNKG